MSNKKLSVIIPVYNCAKYLRQCLDSVINQNFKDFEIICVNDGSTDESAEILEEYEKNDKRISIITQANKGAGVARNVGLEAATGKYILFLDSDDWFEADYFGSAVGKIEIDNADICICGYESFDDHTGKELRSNWKKKKKLLPGEIFSPANYAEQIFQLIDGQVWDKLYRWDFIEKTKIIFPALRAAEDTAFAYQTLLLTERITVLPKVCVHYRINRTGSVSGSFAKNQSAPFDAFKIIYNFLLNQNLMTQYEYSFKSWALEYLVWQVNNAPNNKTRELYCSLFQEILISVFDSGWEEYTGRNILQRGKFLAVKYFPPKLLNLIIFMYKGKK